MKIQSFSDIITNSSSEIFIFKSDLPKNFLESLIKEHVKGHMFDYEMPDSAQRQRDMDIEEMNKYNFYSGEGGLCNLKSADDMDEYEKKEFAKYNCDYMLIIDHNFYATCDWLETQFENIEAI